MDSKPSRFNLQYNCFEALSLVSEGSTMALYEQFLRVVVQLWRSSDITVLDLVPHTLCKPWRCHTHIHSSHTFDTQQVVRMCTLNMLSSWFETLEEVMLLSPRLLWSARRSHGLKRKTKVCTESSSSTRLVLSFCLKSIFKSTHWSNTSLLFVVTEWF